MRNTKGHSFANQQNTIKNSKPFECIELSFVLYRSFINEYCGKSFINKCVPQLIREICRVGKV